MTNKNDILKRNMYKRNKLVLPVNGKVSVSYTHLKKKQSGNVSKMYATNGENRMLTLRFIKMII